MAVRTPVSGADYQPDLQKRAEVERRMAQCIDDWYADRQDGGWDGPGDDDSWPGSVDDWHDSAQSLPEPHADGSLLEPLPVSSAALAAAPTRGRQRLRRRPAGTPGRPSVAAALRGQPDATPREVLRLLRLAGENPSLPQVAADLACLRRAAAAEAQSGPRVGMPTPTPSATRPPAPPSAPTGRPARGRAPHAAAWGAIDLHWPAHCPSCSALVNDQAGCRCT